MLLVDFVVDLPSLVRFREQLPARPQVVEVEVVLREAQLGIFWRRNGHWY
jgi:hypothetical protein